MKAKLPRIDIRKEEVYEAKTDIDMYSDIIKEIVQNVTREITEDLDNTMFEIKDALKNKSQLDDEEILFYITELPILMYYVSERLENLGIKSDSSTALRKERYDAYFAIAVGRTIPDKQSETSELVKSEAVVEQAYKRAYKKVQGMMAQAEALLASLKKVLSYRIDSMQMNNEKQYSKGEARIGKKGKNKREVF